MIYVRKFIHVTRKIKIPGFQGISLWEIVFFFMYSLRKGLIGMRAGAVSFQFFLALIPFGLVLVVLTSYTPGIELEEDIIPLIAALIPDQLVSNFTEGLKQYENSSVSSFLSLGFVFALYFTSNGFNVLIKAFNSSKMKFDKREKWWSVRLWSLGFVIAYSLGIVVSFYVLILMRKGIVIWAESSGYVNDHFSQILGTINFIFLGFVIYCAVALLYYFGPKTKKGFHFFSPGATLAFVLITVISAFYQIYVTNFANYNALYGSLGTVIMLLLWIYMMSFAILIGFELNASIHGAMEKRRLNDVKELDKRYEKNV